MQRVGNLRIGPTLDWQWLGKPRGEERMRQIGCKAHAFGLVFLCASVAVGACGAVKVPPGSDADAAADGAGDDAGTVDPCADVECGQVDGIVCGECADGFLCVGGECLDKAGDLGEVPVPGGPFWMGCDKTVDPECDCNDEIPYHEVNLDAYEISRSEITQASYQKCVEAGECVKPTCLSWNPEEKPAHPAVCISWLAAKQYCEWADMRLCTEAEWEKGARGTDGRVYPWGGEAATCARAVMDEGGPGCATGGTFPVCSKPGGLSPYGLCDMAGNATEWVADWYGTDYYSVSPKNNPQGPDDGTERVIRSGSFALNAVAMRTSFRSHYPSPSTYADLGFRCCRSVQ